MAKALEIPQLDKLAWVVLIPSVTFVASMGDNFSPFCETLATSQLLHERCAKFSQQQPSSWQITRLSTVWLNCFYFYAIQSVAVIVLKKRNRHTKPMAALWLCFLAKFYEWERDASKQQNTWDPVSWHISMHRFDAFGGKHAMATVRRAVRPLACHHFMNAFSSKCWWPGGDKGLADVQG